MNVRSTAGGFALWLVLAGCAGSAADGEAEREDDGSDSAEDVRGAEETDDAFYRECTSAELLAELTVTEARCMCRESVISGERVLRMCADYEEALASCDDPSFGAYQPTCTVSIEDWAHCRNALMDRLERFGCEDPLPDSDEGGCRTLIEQVANCVVWL